MKILGEGFELSECFLVSIVSSRINCVFTVSCKIIIVSSTCVCRGSSVVFHVPVCCVSRRNST